MRWWCENVCRCQQSDGEMNLSVILPVSAFRVSPTLQSLQEEYFVNQKGLFALVRSVSNSIQQTETTEQRPVICIYVYRLCVRQSLCLCLVCCHTEQTVAYGAHCTHTHTSIHPRFKWKFVKYLFSRLISVQSRKFTLYNPRQWRRRWRWWCTECEHDNDCISNRYLRSMSIWRASRERAKHKKGNVTVRRHCLFFLLLQIVCRNTTIGSRFMNDDVWYNHVCRCINRRFHIPYNMEIETHWFIHEHVI